MPFVNSSLAPETAAPAPVVVETQDERTVYQIPEANLTKLQKDVAKLSRRSERMGVSSIGVMEIGSEFVTQANGDVMKMVNVYLMAETPKIDGWAFAARIDHTNETGNIIRAVPNLKCELPAAYRTAAPVCDHCKINRLRRDTFVLWNEATNEFQQVGSTCLAGFFGHDASALAKLAELLGYADEAARASRELGGTAHLQERRWIDLERYLRAAAISVRERGWVSAKAARENGLRATRADAEAIYYNDHHENYVVTDADKALVEAALEWARAFRETGRELSEYEHNIAVIADAQYIEPRSMGLAASIVGVYFNNERRKQAAALNVTTQNVGDLKAVLAFMDRPGSRLEKPKLHLSVAQEGSEKRAPVSIHIAGNKSNYMGSLMITDGEYGGAYYGRVSRAGEWVPSRTADPRVQASVQVMLAALALDPIKTTSALGRKTGKCCFCNTKLTDGRSTHHGYGPTCAQKWDLPWKNID